MRHLRGLAALVVVVVASAGCAAGSGGRGTPEPAYPSNPTSPTQAPTPAPTMAPTQAVTPSPRQPTPTPSPPAEESPDPRWRFFVDDDTWYASPWYDGRHRLMIDFGCTPAPYYQADSRCRGGQGFHHGIDVAIPCGVTLRAGVAGRVVVGGVGAAYGGNAFRIRTAERDLLVGHAQELLVRDGDRVEVGQPIAKAGALGAPDGCHLHLEQRARGGGLSSATNPREVLALAR